MSRSIVIVLLCGALSACSGISDVLLSAPEKVNKAFPPIAEVRVAEEGLRSAIGADSAQLKAFEEQYASRLTLRALTCSQGVTVGRFDSIEKVKGYAVNRSCLAEQDTLLLQYLGLRQIGYRLLQPALRPFVALGALTTLPTASGPAFLQTVAAAPAAGVAMLVGSRGELSSIEIPGGAKIATLPPAPSSVNSVMLSPNGRVAAVSVNNTENLMFVDTETGSKLWDTKELRKVYSWIPEIGAALAKDAKNGALMLIDFQAGSVAPHPVALREHAWAVNVSTSPSRVLVASPQGFTLIEHARNGAVNGVVIKEFALPQGRLAHGAPVLMQAGKSIVFSSNRELMAVDLESGKQTIWPTGEFLAGRFAKLGETTLLVDTNGLDGSLGKAMLFDIHANAFAPVVGPGADGGSMLELAGRIGFSRRKGQELLVGDTVTTAEPVSIDNAVAAFNLARQIARLEQASRERVAPEHSAQELSTLASPSFTVAFDGSVRKAEPPAGHDAAMASHARAGRLEAVGVYQGAAATADAKGRKVGNVTVRVRRGKGVLLVLSSYEPVRWTLVPEPGAVILGVMVSGYYQSEVVGAGRARVLMSGGNYAYELASAEYRALNRQTMLYTGKPIDTFQGKYEGSVFTVGE